MHMRGSDMAWPLAYSKAKRRHMMNETPSTETPSTKSPAEDLVKRLSMTVVGSAGWMKFLGVLLILYGIFLVFTLVGILICWLPIWLGVILFKAAGDAEMASRGAPQKLMDFIQKINRFFLIEGILALIGLIVFLVALFFGIMVGIWSTLGIM
jgi:hypothetical protein